MQWKLPALCLHHLHARPLLGVEASSRPNRVGGTAPVCSSLTSSNFYLNDGVLQRKKKSHSDYTVGVYIEFFFFLSGGSVGIARVVAQQLVL